MAKHVVGFGSHLHLHLHPHPPTTFSFTTTTPTTESTTTFSPSFSTFPSLSSPPSISILRSSPSSIPTLNHEDGRLQNDDHLSSLHLQPICSEDHFDRVVAEAQLRQHALLLVWIANCRLISKIAVLHCGC
ncbi:hypothetical protein QL285_050119 [Trifolium repens]|nr:hypothetical protein QL285_050119 [Trifolium repens]